MITPINAHIVDTPLAQNWVDEFGIIYSISKDAPHSLENMVTHFEKLLELTEGKKLPFLVDPSLARPTTKKERQYLNEHLQTVMTCIAFVTTNAMMRIGINLYFRIRPQFMPMKMFSNEEDARQWLLRQHYPKDKKQLG